MRGFINFLREAFPPKPTFSIQSIPDLTGKVIIVTGANIGIGKETARVLLTRGAKVYIAARNQAQSEATIRQLEQETRNEAVYLKLDLSNLKAVKSAAQEFLSKETQLHVLFNNAGVMGPPLEQATADGHDLQFGTNVLGHYYFTKLLLPTMIATAKSTPNGKARIVANSSSGHAMGAGNISFDTLKDSPERRKLDTMALYYQSKFGNVVVARELARRYADQGIISISVNPGNIRSGLQRHMSRFSQFILDRFLLYDVPFGALTQLYAGTMPEAAELNGKYLIPWARVGTPLRATQDPELGEKLWDWLEEQVKDV